VEAAFFARSQTGRRLFIACNNKGPSGALCGETGRTTLDPRVLDAMGQVPREEFVPPKQAGSAYKSRPLAIGHGQTISQPFIVALMTELLNLKPTDKVLEVGTGSGYQAAVLSLLARQVYTIEIIPELGNAAAATLGRLGYANIKTKIGDGYQGWPAYAPFDAIIVTAAPARVPAALVEQLKPKGRMIIPVAAHGSKISCSSPKIGMALRQTPRLFPLASCRSSKAIVTTDQVPGVWQRTTRVRLGRPISKRRPSGRRKRMLVVSYATWS
jgi:protein-L-isoaspartate(D-aspartate) O-methyltransferase